MKIKYILIVLTTFVFTGCGTGSNPASSDANCSDLATNLATTGEAFNTAFMEALASGESMHMCHQHKHLLMVSALYVDLTLKLA